MQPNKMNTEYTDNLLQEIHQCRLEPRRDKLVISYESRSLAEANSEDSEDFEYPDDSELPEEYRGQIIPRMIIKLPEKEYIDRLYFNGFYNPLEFAGHLHKLYQSTNEEIKKNLFGIETKRNQLLYLVDIKSRLNELDGQFIKVLDEHSEDIYFKEMLIDFFAGRDTNLGFSIENPKSTIGSFIKYQKKALNDITHFLDELIWVIRETDDLDKYALNDYSDQLRWNATDTDLLELIVGLMESNSIKTFAKKNTRKEIIVAFEKIFNINIKDSESKLSRATERKKDISPFFGRLKQAFEDYCTGKEDRKEPLRH